MELSPDFAAFERGWAEGRNQLVTVRLAADLDTPAERTAYEAEVKQTLLDGGAVTAGTTGTYTVRVRNTSTDAPAREVVVTDTLPLPEHKRWDKLTVLSIAPLLANAIREVFTDGSVTSMFDAIA